MLANLLEMNDGTERMLQECRSFVEKSDGIIVFGAGVGGNVFYHTMQKYGLENKIICFSDNNFLKHGKDFCKNEIVPPDCLAVYLNRANVVITSSAYQPIKKQLLNYGFKNNQVALFNFAFMDLEYSDKQYIYDHLEQFEWTYTKLNDQKSKNIYVNLLNYKISKNEKYLRALSIDADSEINQYFDPEIIHIMEDECFVDIGCYIGDTLKEFLRISGASFSSYYAFEADRDTYDIFLRNCKLLDLDNSKLHVSSTAAWDKKTKLMTISNNNSYGSYSFIECVNGENGIDADALDNVFCGNEKITFIKMDIEGAEAYALKGLAKTISKYLPKLAICVYHKRDDYFIIPQLIEKIAPGQYDYYFRQYRYTPTETVCYAIPKREGGR